MTKKEMIAVRDACQDENAKAALRAAIKRIDALESEIRKAALLVEVAHERLVRIT